jgi:hypothetical protein
MRKNVAWLVLGLAVWIAVPGCGPNVSQSDLGTIVFEVPSVAGADEPYKYPELLPLPPGSKPRHREMLPMMPPGPPPQAAK